MGLSKTSCDRPDFYDVPPPFSLSVLIYNLPEAVRESDIEKLGESLEPGHAAAIAVAQEGDQDAVRDILYNQGGEIASMSVTDDLKSALESAAPEGVTVSEEGDAS